jgi:hypothetical protein
MPYRPTNDTLGVVTLTEAFFTGKLCHLSEDGYFEQKGNVQVRRSLLSTKCGGELEGSD